MILVELFRAHGRGRLGPIVGTSLVGGLLGAGTVAVANFASAGDRVGGSLWLGLAYLLALGVMFLSNRWAARAAVEVFEDAQQHLRGELSRSLRAAPLRAVEQLGDARGQVIGDLTFVSNASAQLVNVIQQGAFLATFTVIVATLSGKALLIWIVTCAAMARWFVPGLRRLKALQRTQSGRARAYHAGVEELLDGFKQLKLDPLAGDVLVGDIRAASATLYGGQVGVAIETDRTYLTASVVFFTLGFGLAVFAPEGTIGLGPRLGYELSIMLSLSLGPLTGLLQALPVVSRAESSLGSIKTVLDRLQQHRDGPPGAASGDAWDRIALEGVCFTYDGPPDGEGAGFTVGPIDLTLRPGALVLVTGGNGSGKTTLMKMLLGLYGTSGHIRLDGAPVRGPALAGYRGLFSAIFGGQFLFDRLYGLDAPPERVEALLDRFGILDAVAYDGAGFGHLELSSGQRMRLAMVVALLEDRPICVFDEWTANQDPETTWMYYDTLLPELIAQGKTVIAVSHDDRFFDRADHLIRLDRGRLVIDREQPRAPADP